MNFQARTLVLSLMFAFGSASAQTADSGSLFSPVRGGDGKATGDTTYRPSVNTTLPDLDSDGFNLGGLRVYVNAALRAGYDDNINLAPNTAAAPARGASTLILNAPITAVAKDGFSETRFTANLAATNFSGNSRESFNNNRFSVDHVTQYTARLDSRIGAFFVDGTDPRGLIENQNIEPNRFNNTGASFGGGFGAPGAQGRIEADVRLSSLEYKNNTEITTFLDRTSLDVAGRFLYRVAPKTRAVFELQNIRTNFNNDTGSGAGSNLFVSQDQTDTRASVGARWDATAKTSGAFKVGRTRKQFDQTVADRPNASAGFYDLNLTWLPLTYSSVNLVAGQSFTDSLRTSGAVITQRRGITWSHGWLDRFSTTVSYTRLTDNFDAFRLAAPNNPVVTRKDQTDLLTLAANYRFRPTISVGLEFRVADRQSNIGPGFVLPDGSVNPGTGLADNFNYNKNVALVTVGAVF